MIRVKRVYDKPWPEDGCRYLVDRLWPRGVKKDSLRLDGWLKELAPSESLRRWFNHEPDKWIEFRSRYRKELESQSEIWHPLLARAGKDNITLLYSAKDVHHNNAVALAEFLNSKAK